MTRITRLIAILTEEYGLIRIIYFNLYPKIQKGVI